MFVFEEGKPNATMEIDNVARRPIDHVVRRPIDFVARRRIDFVVRRPTDLNVRHVYLRCTSVGVTITRLIFGWLHTDPFDFPTHVFRLGEPSQQKAAARHR